MRIYLITEIQIKVYRIKTSEDLSDNRNTIKVYRIKTTEDLSDNRNTNKSVQDNHN